MKILNSTFKLNNVFLEANSKSKSYGYSSAAMNEEKFLDDFAVSAEEIRNAFIALSVHLFGLRLEESYFNG